MGCGGVGAVEEGREVGVRRGRRVYESGGRWRGFA